MKPFFHTIVYPVLCVFLVACGQKDFSTLKEVGGEGFIFSSTITALVETGDSLLVGTSDGKISYFNINNGDHSELRNVLGRAIYDIQICGDYLYFAVQDGGVKRVRLDDINNRKPETFKIRDKQGEFSPYDILIADDGISLYAASSNGVYRWDTRIPEAYAKSIKSLPGAAPHRFYSIIQEKSGDIIFAGPPGVFRFDGNTCIEINRSSTRALHDGYTLTDSLRLYDGYEQPEGYSTYLKRKPLNFAVMNDIAGDRLYAVSESAVEIIDRSNNSREIISLPEEQLSQPRNKSSRAVCIIKGSFVYAAPGGNTLYKLPVKHNGSEEIVSICQNDDNELIALSANKDLYKVTIKNDGGKTAFSKPRYYRTVPAKGLVRLLSASDNAVYVIADNSILRLEGKNRTDTLVTPYPKDAGDVTFNLFHNETLFQGRKDLIRSYTYSLDRVKPADTKDYVRGNITVRKDTPDYYPKHAAIVGDELVFGTLHNGVYSVNTLAESIEYRCLIDTLSAPDVKAVESVDDVVFVLTADSLYRFRFAIDGSIADDDSWPIGQFGASASYFDNIVPVSSEKVYFYNDDNDFCRGALGYNTLDTHEEKTRWQQTASLLPSNSFNSAILVKINGHNRPLFCGSMGIYDKDNDFEIAINRPRFYTLRKIHADTYWWGLALVVFCLLVFSGLIAYSYHAYGKTAITVLGKKTLKHVVDIEELPRETIQQLEERIDRANAVIQNLHLYDSYLRLNQIINQDSSDINAIKQEEDRVLFHQLATGLRSWALQNYESGYILELSEELINISDCASELAGNIQKFKNDADKLDTLDRIGCIINEVKRKVSGKPIVKKAPITNEDKQLSNDYLKLAREFFNYYADEDKAVSEWGKVFDKVAEDDRITVHQLSLLWFPLSSKDSEGMSLPDLSGRFVTCKSEWKTGNNAPFGLRNFMDTRDYGLFRLIAGAGLYTIENKRPHYENPKYSNIKHV